MRIESSYPTPIHGVSTLAPRNRRRGQAGAQTNYRSDPVNKLTRRPPLTRDVSLGNLNVSGGGIVNHSYRRDGSTYRIIISKVSKAISVFKDGVVIPTTLTYTPSTYIGDNMVLRTIGHRTYVANKDKVITMLPTTDRSSVPLATHLNVLTALNYGEALTVTAKTATQGPVSVTYTVPNLGSTPDYDTADQARATNEVANQLGILLDGIAFVTASSLGSAVLAANPTERLQLTVSTGQGDRTCVAINDIIESTRGLPLYALPATRVTVRPDPTSDKGKYYLKAEPIDSTVSTTAMSEVVWSEDRDPDATYEFDSTTVPFKVTINPELNTAEVEQGGFRDRAKGDVTSVQVPEFVGDTITDIGYFHKRLMFVTENATVMSEADDEINFWKQSAVKLLVNDPVSVASSAVGVDKIAHVIPHNKDMLLIASNGQFKISGGSPITPETTSMSLTTTYECSVSAPPVTMGNSVFIPITYGDSTGVIEYTGERNTTQDHATPLTRHIVDYMKGDAKVMVANSSLEMIAMTTTGTPTNELFIFEQFTDLDGSRKQMSWSRWVLPTTTNIVDMDFRSNSLTILSTEGEEVLLKSIDMYTKSATSSREIFLDDMLKLPTTGASVEVPVGYDSLPFVVIRGDGLTLELFEVKYTLSGTTVTFTQDVGVGSVYVGRIFESRYQPTRPYRYNEEGVAITTDRLRISRYIVNLVDTNEIKMHIISDFYDIDDQSFNSRVVGGLTNKLGSIPTYTGDKKFSFAQDANLALVEFYCDNHLGCTIAGLSWEGQYVQSKGRM